MIRACGVLILGGKILLQRKRGEQIWAVPGGRVGTGETPSSALTREWIEELGFMPDVGRTLWTADNAFFHRGHQIVQREVFFEILKTDDIHELRMKASSPRDGTLEFRWYASSDLESVDVRPALVRPHLFNWPATTLHLA